MMTKHINLSPRPLLAFVLIHPLFLAFGRCEGPSQNPFAKARHKYKLKRLMIKLWSQFLLNALIDAL